MLFFIIGYMGAGKSVFGRQLADKLGYVFHDLDDLIEKEAGMNIPEIIEQHGEEEFRKVERKVLQDHLYDTDTVISTGGGTPCFYDNMELMNRHGVTIFLDTPVEDIICRLSSETSIRPLLRDIPEVELSGFIKEHLESRRVYYFLAKIRIEPEKIDL
jgi:shikimate kinase